MRVSLCLLTCFIPHLISTSDHGDSAGSENLHPQTSSTLSSIEDVAPRRTLVYDPNGYVLFCLCMGRYGNQIDHLLGGMAFAKSLNRTLLLPPFPAYKNQKFTKWFRLDAVQQFHRSETAEDFMEQLAPTYWPPEKRLGFCWLPPNHEPKKCNMKEGSPFGPFWNGLNVDFVGDEVYSLNYNDPTVWSKAYPPEKYPVLAMRGAPAGFPVAPTHRKLQQYLQFTAEITVPGDEYIKNKFGSAKFVALHLRNGMDWEHACVHADGRNEYMASTQCLSHVQTVTKELCFPSKKTILKLVKKVVKKTNAKFLYVATDQNPMIKEFEKALSKQKVQVFHMDPFPPWVDLYVMSKADHFIGNCVSSFTAFAKRARDLEGKPTSFWGFD